MDIKKYREVCYAFKEVAYDMLNTDEDDGNIQLIRFRRFIQETAVINNLIQEEIKGIDYDYKGNFIVEDGDWFNISIPLDKRVHIKAMYDLEDIEQEIERDTPKLGRVKRAWKRIQDFMTKLPKTVTTYTLMTQQCMELYEKIRPFIGN